MVIFNVMPDELAIGHAGRLAILNGFQTSQHFISALRTQFSTAFEGKNDMPVLELLARAVGMSVQSYASQHSMLAALRVTAQKSSHLAYGAPENSRVTRLLGMTTPRKFICICSKCVADDIEANGFSYYRRKHQLIGIDWCVKHGDLLKRVHSDKPFSKFPDYWDAERLATPLNSCGESLADVSQFVIRYVEIGLSIFKQERPQLVNLVNTRINIHAKQLGFRVGLKGKRPLLSDKIIEMAPPNWPGGTMAKKNGESIWKLDGIPRSMGFVGSFDTYALILAALFDSSDLALEIFLAPSRDHETDLKPKAAQRLEKGFWHGHSLYSIYIKAGGIYSEVAELIKMRREYTSEKLIEVGLPSLRHHDLRSDWSAFKDFSRGSSIEEACARHGAEIAALEKLLRISSNRVTNALKEIDDVRRSSA